MPCADLNLPDPLLSPKALELGFSPCLTPKLVKADSRKAANLISQLGSFAVVEGSSTDYLRDCVRRSQLPLLVNPYLVPRFHLDDGLVRVVAEKAGSGSGACFEIPVADFLRARFVYRAKLIATTRAFLQKCISLRAPFVLTSRASSEWELKSPREWIAVGVLYGLTFEQANAVVTRRSAELARLVEDVFSQKVGEH